MDASFLIESHGELRKVRDEKAGISDWEGTWIHPFLQQPSLGWLQGLSQRPDEGAAVPSKRPAGECSVTLGTLGLVVTGGMWEGSVWGGSMGLHEGHPALFLGGTCHGGLGKVIEKVSLWTTWIPILLRASRSGSARL